MTVTAQNYALVLGELNLDKQQIKAAETLLRENPLLTQVLSDPRVRFAEKEKCLDRIFTPPFSSFMKVLCKHERVYALTEIFEAYQDLCRQKAGTVRAQLLCVEPPSAEQTEKMRAFVKKKFGAANVRRINPPSKSGCAANVELDIAVQPDLLGGFILRCGDCEYDRSVKGKLDKLQQKLTGEVK